VNGPYAPPLSLERSANVVPCHLFLFSVSERCTQHFCGCPRFLFRAMVDTPHSVRCHWPCRGCFRKRWPASRGLKQRVVPQCLLPSLHIVAPLWCGGMVAEFLPAQPPPSCLRCPSPMSSASGFAPRNGRPFSPACSVPSELPSYNTHSPKLPCFPCRICALFSCARVYATASIACCAHARELVICEVPSRCWQFPFRFAGATSLCLLHPDLTGFSDCPPVFS
jgi:hypothetical protein